LTNATHSSSDGEVGVESGRQEAAAGGKVEITCNTCYIKGTATAQFTADGDLTQYVEELKKDVEHIISNVKLAAESFIGGNHTAITEIDFNFEAPELPEYQLHFQFDGMELYMQVDTVLSAEATYTLNLFTSQSMYGVAIGDEQVGVVFKIDLVLIAESELEISSGFHIKLEDGVAIDIALFSEAVSSMTL
jgi:hypothetical protein